MCLDSKPATSLALCVVLKLKLLPFAHLLENVSLDLKSWGRMKVKSVCKIARTVSSSGRCDNVELWLLLYYCHLLLVPA